jgi:hypothetical protein
VGQAGPRATGADLRLRRLQQSALKSSPSFFFHTRRAQKLRSQTLCLMMRLRSSDYVRDLRDRSRPATVTVTAPAVTAIAPPPAVTAIATAPAVTAIATATAVTAIAPAFPPPSPAPCRHRCPL